jgi:hypothetical protein
VIPVLVSGAVAYLLNFLIVCYTPVGDSLGCSDLRSLSTILDGIPSLSVLFLLPVVLSLILMRHSARRNLRYISYVLNRRNSQRFSLFSPNILGVRRYLLGLLAYIIVFASSLVVLAIIYPVFRQPDAVTGAICAGPLFGTLFLLTVSFSMTLIHF